MLSPSLTAHGLDILLRNHFKGVGMDCKSGDAPMGPQERRIRELFPREGPKGPK